MLAREEKKRLIQMVEEELDQCGLYIGDPENTCLFSTSDDYERYGEYFNWRIASGASKLVLFPPNCDYIIKIPFNCFHMSFGAYEDNYYCEHPVPEEEVSTFDYEKQRQILEDSYYDENEENLKEAFQNAGMAVGNYNNTWDYCYSETLLSRFSKEWGLEDIFVPTEWLFNYNGYPIYVQKKCEIEYYFNNEEKYQVSEEAQNTSDRLSKKYELGDLSNSSWLAAALEVYGQKKVCQLIDFIKSYELGDLRNENRGMLNGKPVLIDYCDFYE